MGRGNYYASGDYAAQWYVEYEPDILLSFFDEVYVPTSSCTSQKMQSV